MPRIFSKPSLIALNGNALTDHNRSELGVDVERLGGSRRMANGAMRQYITADKRTFDVSWSDLPFEAEHTVDGFWGGREIEEFYNTITSPATLTIREGDWQSVEDDKVYTVIITDFSKSVNKRGAYDFWDLSLTMEEV